MIPTISQQGYLLKFQPAKRNHPSHIFCGENHCRDAWCPNCNKPLLRLLQLDTSDTRLGLSDVFPAGLPLYYCWTCTIYKDLFCYQVNAEGTISILRYRQGLYDYEYEIPYPYDDYPAFFPETAVELVPLTQKEQAFIYEMNATIDTRTGTEPLDEELCDKLYGTGHQVGGEPFLIFPWNYEEMRCPLCRKELRFCASIWNECLDERGFAGDEWVQHLFFVCLDCHVVMADENTT
ncbi:MAG: hypothetical protein BWY76_00299 [bacterium ADurb.Bin429]|nr:MAG: hypothetical protein BWY76_00299 [bacterium ADurb.Bin429]